MTEIFRKLFDLLSGRERKRFFLLTGLMVCVALAEVFGLSSVLLLLNLFSDPDTLLDNARLAALYDFFGFTGLFGFQVFLSVLTFLLILSAQLIKAGGTYAILRFSAWRGYAISTRLLQAYLGQPYTWFLGHNSAEISKTVLNEVQALVTLVLVPSLRMLSSFILALGILLFLLLVDPVITLLSIGIIGGSYALFYLGFKGPLYRMGQRLRAANSIRFRLVQEATGGLKELKLLSLEGSYGQRFSRAAGDIADLEARGNFLREMPRFIMEALIFGVLLIAILLLLIRNDGDISAAVPILGTFGLAILKLLPAMQQVYYGLASVRQGQPFLNAIHRDFEEAAGSSAAPVAGAGEALPLTRQIEVDAVSYSYPQQDRTALKALSLTVPAHTTVGIVGGTGAGKTTFVDLLLGLLTAQSGEIRVDGAVIDAARLPSWRRSIGYVPQSIFLTDSTVAENIAFGTEAAEIDRAAVERAAKLASLHDFVTAELPEGYNTIVGERGVRLSGGQRQRIGIARALYHDPQLLVLDEATSALDNLTERAVMDAIHNIGHDKTIIMIAHRLTTVVECDRIFLLEQGAVAASGTYDELLETNPTFQRMVAGRT